MILKNKIYLCVIALSKDLKYDSFCELFVSASFLANMTFFSDSLSIFIKVRARFVILSFDRVNFFALLIYSSLLKVEKKRRKNYADVLK